MSFRNDYKRLIEGLASNSGLDFFLTGEQITDKQVAASLTDSILCIADGYMKRYKIPDTKLNFTFERGKGNLSTFPLTAREVEKPAMFTIVAPMVSYIFEEHVIPHAQKLEVCFQLAGFMLDENFDLQARFPELLSDSSSNQSITLNVNQASPSEMTNVRTI